MKKYSVFDFYVVKVEKGDNKFYFICKFYAQNTYKEIFTKEKICVKDKSYVERLSDYYSPIAICSYNKEKLSSKPLMLSRKDLLYKYIEINKIQLMDKLQADEENIKNNYCNLFDIDKFLETAIIDFFPKDGIWTRQCFNKSNKLCMDNLPCHLNDYEWLAEMIKKEKELSINYYKILSFIKKSSIFQEERHRYEQEIVKWQINNMRNGGGIRLCDEEPWFMSPSCDLIFRKDIVCTLQKIGMDIEAIEEGIEKNANLWRDSLMKKAFNNIYEPIIFEYLGCLEFKKTSSKLEVVNPEYKKNWIRMRKYEYYKRNKNSVDKYGIVDDDMTMSDEEIFELQLYLKDEHIKRIEVIEQYKKERYGDTYMKHETFKIKLLRVII